MNCSFGDECSQENTILVQNCKKDTSSHTRYLKCGTEGITTSESLLILNRVGLGLQISNLHKYICPKHRAELGLSWKRKKRSCCHPLHDITSSSTIVRGITMMQSREIWLKMNLNVPIGAGICRRCIDKHKKDVKMGADLKEELKEICNFLEHVGQNTDQMETEVPVTELKCPINQSLNDASEMNIETTDEAISTDPGAIDMYEESMEVLSTYVNSVTQDEISTSVTHNASKETFSFTQNNSQDTQTESYSEDNTCSLSGDDHNSSQVSSWSQSMKSTRDIFNEAMDMLSQGKFEPLRSQVTLPLEKLQYSTKSYYIRRAKSAIEYICESIAPGQGQLLFDELNMPKKTSKVQTDSLTDCIIEAYKACEDHSTKTQILSLIVNKHTKAELTLLIPGVTVYKIDCARKHSKTHGPGQYISPPKITRVRLSKEKIHHFIEFISAPCYLHIVGFGSKHLKLSSGLQVKVPKVIRTMIASRLITAYNNYCKENSINPPSRATLYKIVKACAASQLKSLRGLDNYTSDGMEGIDTLKKIVTNLGEKGLAEGKVSELQETLDSLKFHLKNELKGHLTQESDCLQHCIQYALSEKGCEHNHNTNCRSCDFMYIIENQINDFVKDTKLDNTQEKEEMEHDMDIAKGKIWAWRDHCIRTVNQDLCKTNIIENLKNNEVMIIADFAMKYLPQTFRETQSEWFGKQGISWHMICAIVPNSTPEVNIENQDAEKKFDIFSFVHIIPDAKQGWFSVSQIFYNTLKQLKSIHPQLENVSFRSDNAGCYHSLPLISYLWKFRNELPLHVEEYNFSEAQAGKDLCDSRTGTCRLHIMNYINEGHDITNAEQMKEALESHGGIRNTYVSILNITSENQPVLQGQLKNFQISHYNNFQFSDEGMMVFKAYGIGGELVKTTDMERITENLVLIDDDNLIVASPKYPDSKPDSFRAVKHQDSFPCVEEECIMVFRKEDQLIHHLSLGKHVYDNEMLDTLADKSTRLWSQRCKDIRFNQPLIHQNIESEQPPQFREACGYALRRRKKATRFSVKVKTYLTSLFSHGEDSGKKPSPYTVSKQIRYETDEEGNRMFQPSEWLSHQQIRSFFGNLCIKKQKETSRPNTVHLVKLEEEQQIDDEDLQNVLGDLVANEHRDVVSSIVTGLTV